MPLGIKIVSQNCQGLVELFGKYQHSIESGLHFLYSLHPEHPDSQFSNATN